MMQVMWHYREIQSTEEDSENNRYTEENKPDLYIQILLSCVDRIQQSYLTSGRGTTDVRIHRNVIADVCLFQELLFCRENSNMLSFWGSVNVCQILNYQVWFKGISSSHWPQGVGGNWGDTGHWLGLEQKTNVGGLVCIPAVTLRYWWIKDYHDNGLWSGQDSRDQAI